MNKLLFSSCFITLIAALPLMADTEPNELGREKAADLPQPYATKSVTNHPEVIGWPEGKMPEAPDGFRVTAFVKDLENPRWLYVLPNGDVLVAQSRTLPKPPPSEDEPPKEREKKEKMREGMKKSKTATGGSPNKITLLRDEDGDGKPEIQETFLEDLNQPFGMVLVDDTLFVACTDGVLAFPYKQGETSINEPGMKILHLPAGGYNNHWTRNVIANREKTKLYITVGSASNCAEHGMAEEMLRANILECNFDGTALRVFASGLRNPNGLAWEPKTGVLWTTVNERDELGDELVPDYFTGVREDGFYGWPYAYFGSHEDPRLKGRRPDLVKKSIVPDVPLGSHTAALGLTFCDNDRFPKKYQGGAFIGLRGSWNRSEFSGYCVTFIPFKDGRAAGGREDFLTGFIANEEEVYGRPVGVVFAKDGSLLVADEPSDTIWRVSAE
jgi:glucose/arabinose dehydrogenase